MGPDVVSDAVESIASAQSADRLLSLEDRSLTIKKTGKR
jgi:hypothetical protein